MEQNIPELAAPNLPQWSPNKTGQYVCFYLTAELNFLCLSVKGRCSNTSQTLKLRIWNICSVRVCCDLNNCSLRTSQYVTFGVSFPFWSFLIVAYDWTSRIKTSDYFLQSFHGLLAWAFLLAFCLEFQYVTSNTLLLFCSKWNGSSVCIVQLM